MPAIPTIDPFDIINHLSILRDFYLFTEIMGSS